MTVVEFSKENSHNNNTVKDNRYRRSQDSKDMFRELEHKYRVKNGIEIGKNNENKKNYRQIIEMVYDALMICRQPTTRSRIVNSSYSSPRTQTLIKQLIIHELIQPAPDRTGYWVITEQGWVLLGELNKLTKAYPFLLNKMATQAAKDGLDS